eukprot:3151214-Alexandrium_andersonii.AAC.1
MWFKVYQDDVAAHGFLLKRAAQVGASRGRGVRRAGKFDWAQHKAWCYRKVGSRRTRGAEQLTEREFIARVTEKGKSKEWALTEFNRRRNSDDFENGVDSDADLPT